MDEVQPILGNYTYGVRFPELILTMAAMVCLTFFITIIRDWLGKGATSSPI